MDVLQPFPVASDWGHKTIVALSKSAILAAGGPLHQLVAETLQKDGKSTAEPIRKCVEKVFKMPGQIAGRNLCTEDYKYHLTIGTALRKDL